ncbi:hypothetical protein ACQP0U_27515 [Micromonospora sp. CA-269861]|uniref:hypothetical protein n=1 Tax=Micromonospora sp. CA-269861 TaxID=3239968 RepID=UPI003D8D3707
MALFAAGAPPWWQARLALAAAGLSLVAALAARRHRVELIGYAVTGAVVAVTVPALAPLVGAGEEPLALYAALAALGVAFVVCWLPSASASGQAALGDRPMAAERESARSALVLAAGGTLVVVAVLAALPTVLTALVSPHGGRDRVWAGVPAVVADPTVLPVGFALVVLAVAAALAGRRVGLPVLPALPFVAAALPVLLVAIGAPWPVLPAAVLLAGLAALLFTALAAARPRSRRSPYRWAWC